MPLDLFFVEENDTRLIKFQNTVYKLKVVYNNHQRVKNVCSQTSTHNQIEQVLRAVLYMDQRETDFSILKPIITTNFIVTVSKKYWKTSEKVDFKKNGVNLKVYDHLFEFLVQVRDSNEKDRETSNASRQSENQRLYDSSASSLRNNTNKHKLSKSKGEYKNKVDNPRQRCDRSLVYDHGAASKPKVQKRTQKHVDGDENEQHQDTCQNIEDSGRTDKHDSYTNERSPVISKRGRRAENVVIDELLGCSDLNNDLPGKKMKACGIKSRKTSSIVLTEMSQADSGSESEKDNGRITRRNIRLTQESRLNPEQPRRRSLRKQNKKEDTDSENASEYDDPNISEKKCEKYEKFLLSNSSKKIEKSERMNRGVKMHTRRSSRLSQESTTKTDLPPRNLRPRKEKCYQYIDSQTDSDTDSSEINSSDDFTAARKMKRGTVFRGKSELEECYSGSESVKLDVKLLSSNRAGTGKQQRPKRKKMPASDEDDVTNVDNILGGSFKVQKFRKKLNANQQLQELAVPRRLRHRLYNRSDELITSLPEVSTRRASRSSPNSCKAKKQEFLRKNMMSSGQTNTKEVELSGIEPSDNFNSSAFTHKPLQIKTSSRSTLSTTGRGKVELVVQELQKNSHNTTYEANMSTASPVICSLKKSTLGSDRILRSYKCDANTPKTAFNDLEGSRKSTPGSDRILRSYRTEQKKDSIELNNSELSPVKVPVETARKRRSSGLWNFVEAILTPVKRFLSAHDGE